jgi:hypothetical protein
VSCRVQVGATRIGAVEAPGPEEDSLTPTPRDWSRRHARALVAAILVAVALSGCSSDHKSPAASPSTATTTPAPSTTPTTTADAGAAAVAGYRAFWQAYLAAAEPMNPEHPGLAEHATGDELAAVRKAFLGYKAAGSVIRGTLDLAPKATTVDANTVLVRDCYDDQTGVYSVADGTRQDQENPKRHLVTATVVQESGVWKVAAIKIEGDGCTPG